MPFGSYARFILSCKTRRSEDASPSGFGRSMRVWLGTMGLWMEEDTRQVNSRPARISSSPSLSMPIVKGAELMRHDGTVDSTINMADAMGAPMPNAARPCQSQQQDMTDLTVVGELLTGYDTVTSTLIQSPTTSHTTEGGEQSRSPGSPRCTSGSKTTMTVHCDRGIWQGDSDPGGC